METVVLQRRAVRAIRALKAGVRIGEADVISLRPAPTDCVPPYKSYELFGRTLLRDIEEGDCIKLVDVK